MAMNGQPETNGTTELSSPGQRIKKLNEIAESIPALLQSASAAVSLLAGSDDNLESTEHKNIDADHIDDSDPQAARKRAFVSHVRAFYNTLRHVKDDLHVEIDKLSEAGLLGSELHSTILAPGVTNGGLGELDIGWLNSRAKDVGLGKEKELVKELRELLESYAVDKSETDRMET